MTRETGLASSTAAGGSPLALEGTGLGWVHFPELLCLHLFEAVSWGAMMAIWKSRCLMEMLLSRSCWETGGTAPHLAETQR